MWFTKDGLLSVTYRTGQRRRRKGRTPWTNCWRVRRRRSESGVGTEIPADTEWMNLLVDDGVATVDLNEAFVSEETPAAAVARLAQVVYTLAVRDSIGQVVFQVDEEAAHELRGLRAGRRPAS